MRLSAVLLLVASAIALPPGPAPNGSAFVDVFTSGVGYLFFRIPSMLRLADGRILLFAEGRNVAADTGWVDIVFRTSLDTEGESWGPADHALLRVERLAPRDDS